MRGGQRPSSGSVASSVSHKIGFRHIPRQSEHLEIIINTFPSLDSLALDAIYLATGEVDTTSNSPPPPPATRTLRNLTMKSLKPLFVTQFVPNFTNLTHLVLSGLLFTDNPSNPLDLQPLSAALPNLTDLSLQIYFLTNIQSVANLANLSSLQFNQCHVPDLSFLTPQNALPQLTTLCLHRCQMMMNSAQVYAPLSNAMNLRVLKINFTKSFNDDCLQYLENMDHLRVLDLSDTNTSGGSRSLKILMQHLIQLEELKLAFCRIGGHDVIAGALYSPGSRLRTLNLVECDLVDDDLDGIGALKNTLEVLDLEGNMDLTKEGLVYCKDLVKLKNLKLKRCIGIDDLSPLKDCFNVTDLDVSYCHKLKDDSFKVFSDEPNSFPNLRVLNMSSCKKLTEKVFDEYLSNNNHLVCQLEELHVPGTFNVQNHIGQFKALRRLYGLEMEEKRYKMKCVEDLRNIEELE